MPWCIAKLARVETALAAASEDAGDHGDLFGTQLWTVAREVYTVGQPFLADLKKHEGALWEHVNAFRRRQIYSRIQESTRVGKRHGTIREEVEPRILAGDPRHPGGTPSSRRTPSWSWT